jgi:hypothetical protein
VRQGCISLGETKCNGCQRTIPYSERYLMVDEENGVEVESGEKSRYCVDCCLEKGYAQYREEKGERVLTFFPSESKPE